MRREFYWIFVVFAVLAYCGPVQAEKRVALVIGNSAYHNTSPLTNPRNDAADVAATLQSLGFETVSGLDLDKRDMERLIRDFSVKLAGADTALFFFAGHGLQVGNTNYLVPVDAELLTGAALDFEMIRLDLVQRTMEREAKTSLIFLDACRDNPLSRNLARAMGTRSTSIGKGLAPAESGIGTLISYSTQPGNVALDGDGRNSPYASALIKHLPDPGSTLSATLINVRRDVMAATQKRQVPWEHSALTGQFYFANAPIEPAVRPDSPSAPSAQSPIHIELSKLEPSGDACKIYVVVTNALDLRLAQFKLDIVLFDLKGDLKRRFAVDLAPVRNKGKAVKVFDLTNTDCATVGSLLLNNVMQCASSDGPFEGCADKVELGSRTRAKFTR